MRKQVLTSTLNQSRKVLSSFHIREVRIIFDHLTFLRKKELQKLYEFSG